MTQSNHSTIKYVYWTNGEINKRIPSGCAPPDGFYRGRVRNYSDEAKKRQVEKTRQTKLQRYGSSSYNNMSKNKSTKLERYGDENYNNREKAEQTCIEKYGVKNPFQREDFISENKQRLIGHKLSQATKDKISKAHFGTHLTSEKRIQKLINTDKTYRKNGIYKKHKACPEQFVENILITQFGKDNVFYNYIDPNRYPFKCDFYIKSEDLFIEIHAGWRHGDIPFNCNDNDCIQKLNIWKEKAKTSDSYKNAIYTWTDLDVRKVEIAKRNNLNFVRLYPYGIYFINEKPRELLGTLVSMYSSQDNQQPRLPIWK